METTKLIDKEGNVVQYITIDKENCYIITTDTNGKVLDTEPFGKALANREEYLVNEIYLEVYEEKGIDTSAVRNGTLTLEQFEKGIERKQLKENLLTSGIVLIILLLIIIIFKQKKH